MYVPINWRLSKQEIEELLKDSEAEILLYDHQFMSFVDSLYCKEKMLMDIMELEKKETKDRKIASSDPWLMIYTGGTTGKPKGVVLSHKAVNTNAINTIVSWSISENDKTINYMPLFHTGGINALSIPILMVGGTVI